MTETAPDIAGLAPNQDDVISDADFEKLCDLAYRLAGLTIPATKRSMVQSRIARRLRTLGRRGIANYIDFVSGSDAGDEREAFISVMTTNVSSFLRERHHFEMLEAKVMPDLLAAAASGSRIRIWSAGCSSGQEPYTLAMLILKMDRSAASKDIQILATDIDHDILARARKGLYEPREIEVFSETDQAQFFERSGEKVQVRKEVRKLIAFKHLNLNGPWPMTGRFDVIFCRNVVIYFDTATQQALWPRFRAQLKDAGWLFLGHSERMQNPAAFGFAAEGVTTYRTLSD